MKKKELKPKAREVNPKVNKDDKWIQNADIKKGALREKLKVPEGKKIPATKLEKASHSKNPKTRKQADLAITFSKMRKKK